MPFITSFERRGRKEGRKEAYCDSILSLLKARFGAVPPELRERVLALRPSKKLARLVTLAGTVDSLQQFGLEFSVGSTSGTKRL